MRKANKITYTLAAILAVIVLFISSLWGGGYGVAYAATSITTQSAYELQNVFDDLQGVTINGNGFDLSLYNFDERKNVQVISFVEFAYSPFKNLQDDYGLYAYVYNPRGYDFAIRQGANKIQFRYTGKTTSEFVKYPLVYINRSEKAGYEGLFYKFKIVMTERQKTAILAALNSTARVYEVSGIELFSSGTNAVEYKVSNTYTYTGFAKGYGSESATTDSLTCMSSNLLTLSLDVHEAVYRPSGTNGKNNYTQDMLHSVYFSIPNKILKNYGGLSAVHATWLNAKTAPIFVTGNDDMYNALLPYVGVDIPAHKSFRQTCGYGFRSDVVVYNAPAGNMSGKIVNRLNYLFKAPDINADNYTLKGSALLDYISERSTSSKVVADKYSENFFESWDNEFTDITIQAEEEFSLTSETITQSWWEKFMNMQGTQVVNTSTFSGIKKIQEVDNTYFVDDTSKTCQNLYIDESYYTDFKYFYDTATAREESVFLFRFYQSEYICDEAEENLWRGTNTQPDLYKALDTNAYVAQEVLNLDFDIIDVTCSSGEVNTVIPCVSSPIDLVPDIDPPVNTTDKGTGFLSRLIQWFKRVGKYILSLVLIIICVVILFKVLAWLIERIGKLFNKKE